MVDINIQRIYGWWLDELSKALTPQRRAERPWQTMLLSTPAGLEIHIKAAGAAQRIGTLAADADARRLAELKRALSSATGGNPKDVLLRLSDSDVVARIIQVPKAASDVLGPIVRNQLERFVPWPESEAYFGYRIVGTNAKAPAQLDVRIVATSRAILDGMLAAARGLGIEPSAADFAPSTEADAPVELMSRAPDPTKKTAGILQTALLTLVVGCTAIGAFGLYSLWDRQAQRDDLAEKIAMINGRVEVNRRLNIRNAELKRQRERLVGEKTASPAVMMLIERLSGTLPDSAYLTELEIRGGDARIVGKSDSSTPLITVLEATDEFEDVRFSAPTTREEGESMETFSIVAKVHGHTATEKQK